jgi:hypothetical protein
MPSLTSAIGRPLCDRVRGCLSVLVIATLFVLGVGWFGGPQIASAVVRTVLTGSGLQADDLVVAVEANPPLSIALGRADEVTVEGTNVRWNDLRADSLSLTLKAVNLIDRTAVSADGFLDNVDLAQPGTDPVLASVAFNGSATAAKTTIRIDAATVERLALAAFQRALGREPQSVTLVGPNVLRIVTNLGSVDATLEIDTAGILVARASIATLRLVDPGASTPIKLNSVTVHDGELELTGTLDVTDLLR